MLMWVLQLNTFRDVIIFTQSVVDWLTWNFQNRHLAWLPRKQSPSPDLFSEKLLIKQLFCWARSLGPGTCSSVPLVLTRSRLGWSLVHSFYGTIYIVHEIGMQNSKTMSCGVTDASSFQVSVSNSICLPFFRTWPCIYFLIFNQLL